MKKIPRFMETQTIDADPTTLAIDDAIKDQIKTFVQSTVGVRVDNLTTNQLKVLLGLVLYMAGAIDSELKIKPIGEWFDAS